MWGTTIVLQEHTNCLPSILAKKFCKKKEEKVDRVFSYLLLFTSRPLTRDFLFCCFHLTSTLTHFLSIYTCLRSSFLHLHPFSSAIFYRPFPLTSFILSYTFFLTLPLPQPLLSVFLILSQLMPIRSHSCTFHLRTANRVRPFFSPFFVKSFESICEKTFCAKSYTNLEDDFYGSPAMHAYYLPAHSLTPTTSAQLI